MQEYKNFIHQSTGPSKVIQRGELRLSGNHTVTEYEMSGKPYSQKSGLKNHTNERIFKVMTRFDQFMTRLWPFRFAK